MIRALYTAASGMNAQQTNIDNIAHNLANVNTTGFKKSRVEFEDLVYQQTKCRPGRRRRPPAEAPVGLEIGLGTRPVAHGPRLRGGQPAVDERARSTWPSKGAGFFQVSTPDGTIGYTRAGALHLSAEGSIVTADGYPLEPQITIPANATLDHDLEGRASCRSAMPGQSAAQQVGTIELATFQNPAGLVGARRQPLCNHDGVGRADDRRAGHRRHRHDRPGLPRRVERQRGRGDGQHDPRPARLRGEFEGRESRR